MNGMLTYNKFMGGNKSDVWESTASSVCVCDEKIKGEDEEARHPIKGFREHTGRTKTKQKNAENIFKAECMCE